MAVLHNRKGLRWTAHARAKMAHYRLSEARVRRVLHSPRRIEEGVAPKTIAMMQPASFKKKDVWTSEIWVMVEDTRRERNVISAWRYPGVTKPRAEITKRVMRQEYREFLSGRKSDGI